MLPLIPGFFYSTSSHCSLFLINSKALEYKLRHWSLNQAQSKCKFFCKKSGPSMEAREKELGWSIWVYLILQTLSLVNKRIGGGASQKGKATISCFDHKLDKVKSTARRSNPNPYPQSMMSEDDSRKIKISRHVTNSFFPRKFRDIFSVENWLHSGLRDFKTANMSFEKLRIFHTTYS